MNPLQRPLILTVAASLALAMAALAWDVSAQAADPRAAERAARRTQLQLQQLQTELRQAQAARAEAEASRDDLARKLQVATGEVQRASAAKRSQSAGLTALQTEREGLADKLRASEATLEAERKAALDAIAAKDAEIARSRQQQLERDAAAKEQQARFVDQVRLVTECTGRNEKLLELNAQLIEQVRTGRVGGQGLRANDPLLGFGRVDLFNLMQDQRDRAEAQRFLPVAEAR